MTDERNHPWLTGTIAGVRGYARERYGIELPEDFARIICEHVIAGSGTVDGGIAAYWWATTGQKLGQRISGLWGTLVEQFWRTLDPLMQVFHQYAVLSRRIELCGRLPSWLPAGVRAWLSVHWPERWLPAGPRQ